jgi:nicotinamidase-related amidase
MSRAALLLIDFFYPQGFEPEALGAATVRAARNAAKLKARLRKRGVPAIYANDNFGQWESEFSGLVEQCRAAQGAPSAIADVLAPQPGDRSVLKPRHSAFYETPLDFLLDDLGATTVILTGQSADSCIMFTAHDAYLRKLMLWVPADCVASPKPAYTRAALAHQERVLHASIAPSESDLARQLARHLQKRKSATSGK